MLLTVVSDIRPKQELHSKRGALHEKRHPPRPWPRCTHLPSGDDSESKEKKLLIIHITNNNSSNNNNNGNKVINVMIK